MLATEPRVLTARAAGLSAAQTLAAVAGLAVALTLAAQIRIPLPFTPVPITLQTLALYLGAIWLGSARAIGGVTLYVAVALLGLPVMSGFRGGLAAFGGATGGYIVGWLLAAWLLGRYSDPLRPALRRNVPAMLVASAVVLFCGALHLALLLDLGPGEALLLGVLPFLPGDLLKVLSAGVIAKRWPDPLKLR